MEVPLVLELHCQQTLRFSVSDIAAVTGFHPFRVLPHLLLRLVYQGTTGYWLQRRDANALGLTLVESEEEIWKSLAEKSGNSTKKALQKALTQSTKTVQEAQQVKQQVVQHALDSGKLKPQELKVLQDGIRHVVNTRFGQDHEDNALDQCEQQFGWEIFDRNTHILQWPFQKVADDTVEPMGDAKPCWTRSQQDDDQGGKRGAATTSNKRQRREQETVDLTGDGDDSQEVEHVTKSHSEVNQALASAIEFQVPDSSRLAIGGAIQAALTGEVLQLDHVTLFNPKPGDFQTKPGPLGPHPFFVIRGSVDGRRDELMPNNSASNFDSIGKSDNDDDSWVMKPVIVELKHRMNRLFHFPPLYEQIQAVAYCLMYRVNDADIVQVMRHEEKIYSAIDKMPNDKTKASTEKVDRKGSKPRPEKGKNSESIVPFLKETQSVGGLENRDPDLEVDHSGEHRGHKTPKETTENTDVVVCEDAGEIKKVHHYKAVIGSKAENLAEECKEVPAASEIPTCTRDIVPLDIFGSREDPLPNEIVMGEEKESPAEMTQGCDSNGAIEAINVAQKFPHRSSSRSQELKVENLHVVMADHQTTTKTRARHRRRLTMQADRISLNDPIFQHGRNWHDVILPRLRSFAEAVYAIRRDDTKRYRLLIACSDPLGQLETQGWELIHEECPWLRSCDTAFNRQV
jgi:hypothetical protein